MAAEYLEERGKGAATRRSVLPVRVFLRRARGLRNGAAASESGDEVALVGLFDTTMSALRWPLRSWLSIAPTNGEVRRQRDRLSNSYLAGGGPESGRRACERLRGFLKSASSRVLRVAASAPIASARYRPGFYAVELTLFTQVKREPGLPSSEAIWGKHARARSIVDAAGTHSTMFSAPNAGTEAASGEGRAASWRATW
jgi:thioesterase domain-containing protein